MAGQDFAQVCEPDFNPDLVTQDKKITDYLKALIPAVRDLYFHPPQKLIDHEKQGEFFVREKKTFYDTENIVEQQKEYVLDCPDCPGLYMVESSSTKTPFCLGIEAGRDCCLACRERARQELDTAQRGLRYAVIQFIDRHQDLARRIVGDAMDKEM
jgi:hypothetical protein